MTIWAIADIHLAISTPQKTMEVFGPSWKSYHQKIQDNWNDLVSPNDLVLIAGDISWAMRIEEAKIDLDWIHALPGTKVMIKGNHDYWWGSLNKLQQILPPSIHLIQNNSFFWNGVAIGGARLWDSNEYNFDKIIEFQETPASVVIHEESKEDPKTTEKIFMRELGRLETSLKSMDPRARQKIVMTHYPPISFWENDKEPNASQVSRLLEKYKVNACIFGHLHAVKKNLHPFHTKNGVEYIFVAGDYLDFKPVKVLDL
ncbi:putative phosphoesterase [Candidatus Rubidus massiliensis]|nr:putative phosphoesterase [Candidatus Rubidus massiliensis]